MANLVQSALGGNASGSFTSGAGGVATATGSLSSATTPGNFLVLIAYNVQNVTSGSGFEPSTIVPSTPGMTWVSVLTASPGDVGTVRAGSTLFYKSNAPSISSATLTSVAYNILSGGAANGNMSIEFALYEFSGVSTSTSTGFPAGALIDQEATNNSQVGGNPTISFSTTNTDLIIVFFRGNSSNASVPAGYTLGQNMSVVTVGQMAWNGNVASGAQTVTFTGAQSNWGMSAFSLRQGPVQAFRRNNLDDLPIWCHSYTAPEGKDKFRGPKP